MRAEEGDETITELAGDAARAGERLAETVSRLDGRKVAILATDGVERREFEEPGDAVRGAGATTELLSLQQGSISLRDHDLDPAGEAHVQRLVAEANVSEFDALLVPGGTVNADKLRHDPAAVKFVRDFVTSGKPVALICHGPWTLIDAGVAQGRTLTSYGSVHIDLRNAGATVIDQEVVVDGNLITSRTPDDLPAFCAAVVDAFAGR